MTTQQIINAQKELDNRRKRRGIKAPLSTALVNSDREQSLLRCDGGTVRDQSTSTPVDMSRPPFPLTRGPTQTSHQRPASTPPQDDTQAPRLPQECRIQPVLALAFLRHFPAVGRHYDLLRNYDRESQNGRGLVELATAHELLKAVCSKRRTQQILKQGQGKTWDVNSKYIRLYSPAKVAVALDAGYLRGNQVIADTDNFTSGIQQVKAIYYASLHTTRKLKEGEEENPIKRATLEYMTGVKPRTQSTYDKLIKADGKPIERDADGKPIIKKDTKFATKIRKNIHIFDSQWKDTEARHNAAIDHGHIFAVYDRKRKQTMIGRPMPNSYSGTLKTARYGRKKKVNRKIRDALVQNEGPGNIKEKRVTIFHPNENAALTALNRQGGGDLYYRVGSRSQPTVDRPCMLRGFDAWYGVSV